MWTLCGLHHKWLHKVGQIRLGIKSLREGDPICNLSFHKASSLKSYSQCCACFWHVNCNMPRVVLSCMSHLSLYCEHWCFVLWIQKLKRKRSLAKMNGLKNRDREKKGAEEDKRQCSELTPHLMVRHLQLGHSPSIKLASNRLGSRVSPWEYQEWQAVCLGLHMDHLFSPSCFSPISAFFPQPILLKHTKPSTRRLSHSTLAISIGDSKEIWNCLWSRSLGN